MTNGRELLKLNYSEKSFPTEVDRNVNFQGCLVAVGCWFKNVSEIHGEQTNFRFLLSNSTFTFICRHVTYELLK